MKNPSEFEKTYDRDFAAEKLAYDEAKQKAAAAAKKWTLHII